MFFTPRDSTEAAGLLIFKNEKHQYFLCRSEKGLELRQISGSNKCKVLAFSVLPDYVERVYLRAECKGTTYSFFYRLEGSGVDDWTVIAENVDASFVSSKVGGFTGTTIGVYAEKVNY
jgi:alpha-N-arabinofuranosidase